MNVKLAAAFQATDAAAQRARQAAEDVWTKANAADGEERTALIVEAKRLDAIAEELMAKAATAAEAFLAAGGVLA